jgi:hypothetical protein
MSVKTPTTPPAIHAPCHKEIEMSLTLETPFGKPMPEISSDLNEQPERRSSAGRKIAATRIKRLLRGACDDMG